MTHKRHFKKQDFNRRKIPDLNVEPICTTIFTAFAHRPRSFVSLQTKLTWSQVTRTVHCGRPSTTERLQGRSVVHQPVSCSFNQFSFSSDISADFVEVSPFTATPTPLRRPLEMATRCIRHSGQSATNRHRIDSHATRSVGDRRPATGSRCFRDSVTAL